MAQDLASQAASPDVETRRKAALALPDLPADQALSMLDSLLGDANWRVRKASVESLLALPGERVLPILFDALYDPENAGKRNSAIETLIKLGKPVLPHVYDHLVEGDLDVKLALITLLGEIPDKSSTPHLIYYLSHENKNISSAAITSLGRLRDTGNLPVLFDIFRRQDDWLCFHLIDALSSIGGPVATAKLTELYETSKYRKAVLKAFGAMGDPQVLPFLLERASASGTPLRDILDTVARIYHANIPAALLPRHQREVARLIRQHFPMEILGELEEAWEEMKVSERRGFIVLAGSLADLSLLDRVLSELENPYLQRDAYEAALAYGPIASRAVVERLHRGPQLEQKVLLIRLLGALGGPEAVVPLLNQAKEDDLQIRMEALTALGEVEDLRCIDELTNVLRESDPTFHETALRAIQTFASKFPAHREKISGLGERMAGDGEEGVRRSGYALMAEGPSQDLSPLLPGLRDPSSQVRQIVVRIVAERMGASAFQTLLPMLGDASPKVRRSVVSALGRELLSRQPETLMTALADVDLWVRSEAAAFLAQSTDPAVGQALLKLLEEDELPVRLGALRGLAEVGCGTLFPTILGLARSQDAPIEIRQASLAALARSGRPDAIRVFTEALSDPHWEVRSRTIELMGASNDRRYIPILLRELEKDPDPLVKQTVVQALLSLKAIEAVPRMLNYLTDANLKDAAFSFFTSLGKEHIRLIENEAQSVDFQTKLILIEILKHLESL